MDAKKLIKVLTDFSPHALLVAMIMTFVIAGKFQADRLDEHGMIMALLMAVTTQVIRLSSGLTSAAFFKEGDYGRAALTITFSLAVTIFETTYELFPEVIAMIWAGLFLELFLGLSMVKN